MSKLLENELVSQKAGKALPPDFIYWSAPCCQNIEKTTPWVHEVLHRHNDALILLMACRTKTEAKNSFNRRRSEKARGG